MPAPTININAHAHTAAHETAAPAQGPPLAPRPGRLGRACGGRNCHGPARPSVPGGRGRRPGGRPDSAACGAGRVRARRLVLCIRAPRAGRRRLLPDHAGVQPAGEHLPHPAAHAAQRRAVPERARPADGARLRGAGRVRRAPVLRRRPHRRVVLALARTAGGSDGRLAAAGGKVDRPRAHRLALGRVPRLGGDLFVRRPAGRPGPDRAGRGRHIRRPVGRPRRRRRCDLRDRSVVPAGRRVDPVGDVAPRGRRRPVGDGGRRDRRRRARGGLLLCARRRRNGRLDAFRCASIRAERRPRKDRGGKAAHVRRARAVRAKPHDKDEQHPERRGKGRAGADIRPRHGAPPRRRARRDARHAHKDALPGHHVAPKQHALLHSAGQVGAARRVACHAARHRVTARLARRRRRPAQGRPHTARPPRSRQVHGDARRGAAPRATRDRPAGHRPRRARRDRAARVGPARQGDVVCPHGRRHTRIRAARRRDEECNRDIWPYNKGRRDRARERRRLGHGRRLGGAPQAGACGRLRRGHAADRIRVRRLAGRAAREAQPARVAAVRLRVDARKGRAAGGPRQRSQDTHRPARARLGRRPGQGHPLGVPHRPHRGAARVGERVGADHTGRARRLLGRRVRPARRRHTAPGKVDREPTRPEHARQPVRPGLCRLCIVDRDAPGGRAQHGHCGRARRGRRRGARAVRRVADRIGGVRGRPRCRRHGRRGAQHRVAQEGRRAQAARGARLGRIKLLQRRLCAACGRVRAAPRRGVRGGRLRQLCRRRGKACRARRVPRGAPGHDRPAHHIRHRLRRGARHLGAVGAPRQVVAAARKDHRYGVQGRLYGPQRPSIHGHARGGVLHAVARAGRAGPVRRDARVVGIERIAPAVRGRRAVLRVLCGRRRRVRRSARVCRARGVCRPVRQLSLHVPR